MKTPCSRNALFQAVLATALSLTPLFAAGPTSEKAPSAGEILKNSIKYHDPEGKWGRFSGQVRLVTNYGNGANRGEEILELRNAEKFYQSTRRRGTTVAVMGLRGGTCFRSVDGNSAPSEALIKQYNLSDSNIKGSRQHHTAHVGFVMEAAASGAELSPTVTSTEFHGQKVYALTLTGRPGKISDSYWTGDCILYIDRQSFALHGCKFVSASDRNQTVLMLGTLDIAGIKVPRAKVYYNNAGVFSFADIFTRP